MKNYVYFYILIFLLGTINVYAWDEVAFETDYNNEPSMTLLLQYGLGTFEMSLESNKWVKRLEMPDGRYNYVYSINSTPKDIMSLYDNRQQDMQYLSRYVGYERKDTEHYCVYYKSNLPVINPSCITSLLETI